MPETAQLVIRDAVLELISQIASRLGIPSFALSILVAYFHSLSDDQVNEMFSWCKDHLSD